MPNVEEVTFEEIHGSMIQDAAKNMSGAGGPTKIDSDVWKHILCSKVFGKIGKELADEIAILARKLCTKDIQNSYISSLEACRLIPLIKETTGVRPIGIGEVLRRIIGKCVSKLLRNDILRACGTLQTCSGLQSGIEAAIHAISRTFEDDKCESVLLVDAENAFNRLNREVVINNIGHRCPPLYRYLKKQLQRAS